MRSVSRSVARPRRARALPGLLAASLAASACVRPTVEHPLAGKIRPSRAETAYSIYSVKDWLHVRVTSGDRAHRFQGSITAIRGSLGPLELSRANLAEQVAMQGLSVHFDLDTPPGAEEGFRVRVDHACLRFDLYVDGARRTERIRLGGDRIAPRSVPFERCP